jgi:phosphatidylglycerophosphate synthase
MVSLTKQAADFITLSRALLIPILIWLGFSQGQDALPLVIWLVLYNWTADSLDGPLARRSPAEIHTWLGDHDLVIDMLFATGLLAYLIGANFIAWQVGAIYLLLWMIYFGVFGLEHALGMVYQAPIFGWFLYVAVRDVPQVSIWIGVWMVVALIVTWPKIPKVVIPGFINDMRALISRD